MTAVFQFFLAIFIALFALLIIDGLQLLIY